MIHPQPTRAQARGIRRNFRPGRVEFTLPLFRVGVEPLPLAYVCEFIS